MQINMPHDRHILASGVLTGLVDRDEHVLLTGEVSRAALDNLAAQLGVLRSRVLRPLVTDALTLPGLLAQIIGRAPGEMLEAVDLERGFEQLTDGGPGCDRVVLILDCTDALDPAALRYLQMVSRDAPLRLLFVGGPKLYGLLMQDEFSALRGGFVEHAAAVPHIASPVPVVAPLILQTAKSGHRLPSRASIIA